MDKKEALEAFQIIFKEFDTAKSSNDFITIIQKTLTELNSWHYPEGKQILKL